MEWLRDPIWQFVGVVITVLTIFIPIWWEKKNSSRSEVSVKNKSSASKTSATRMKPQETPKSQQRRRLLEIGNALRKENGHIGMSVYAQDLLEVAQQLKLRDEVEYLEREFFGWPSQKELPYYRKFTGIILDRDLRAKVSSRSNRISNRTKQNSPEKQPLFPLEAIKSDNAIADLEMFSIKNKLQLMRHQDASRIGFQSSDTYDIPVFDKVEDIEKKIGKQNKHNLVVMQTYQAAVETVVEAPAKSMFIYLLQEDFEYVLLCVRQNVIEIITKMVNKIK